MNKQSVIPITILPNLDEILNDGDDFRSILATMVKQRRKKLNLTQVELANRLGISLNFLRKSRTKYS